MEVKFPRSSHLIKLQSFFLLGLIIAFEFACSSPPKPTSHESRPLEAKRVFGVTLRWGASSQANQAHLTTRVAELEQRHTFAMDPDCRWRPLQGGSCANPYPLDTARLDAAAEKYRVETLGYFDVRTHKKGRPVRDYAGLSQGYFIDEIKTDGVAPFVMDFAGDIYISGPYEGAPELTVAEPVLEEAPFSRVEMSEGWMLASTARDLGAKMRNPLVRGKSTWKEEFLRVVLFAEPSFEGARLDAWATAIVVGGEKLLQALWQRQPERGRWAYLVFDRDLKPRCSPNIDCKFAQEPKIIHIQWSKH